MEEQSNSTSQSESNREEKKKVTFIDLLNTWKTILAFLHEVLDIRDDTDKDSTIENIIGNISMKGHNAWILVFSILIASIGLNVSSTAVVIGAMLISPLMGPILGIGLSIGINDIDTLKKSLTNFAVMIGLSLVTSFFFFLFPIFRTETPELIARTAPDVRDVFIAIAGGLALIIAMSRRNKQINTIAGVAIATALMPPLCTAGFGLAIGNLNYFAGAMFLFIINSIFIALATFVTVKFLGFPVKVYLNSSKRKLISNIASGIALIIFAGSIYLFVNLYKENKFKTSANTFILEIKKMGISIIDEQEENIDYKNREIKLVVYGNELSQAEIAQLNNRLPEFGLNNTQLKIQQGSDVSDLRKEIENLTDLYVNNQQIISSRDESIKAKEDKIKLLENELSKFYNAQIPFLQISQEARINYNGLRNISYANVVQTDFNSIDTITVFRAQWYDSIPESAKQEMLLEKWLKTRLELDTLVLINDSKNQK